MENRSVKFCLLFLFLFSSFNFRVEANGSEEDSRIDCLLTEEHMYEQQCVERGCIWKQSNKPRVPWCFVDNKIGYKTDAPARKPDSLSASFSLKDPSTKEVNCARVSDLAVKISYVSEKIVRIQVRDAKSKRYEVPIQSEFNIPAHATGQNLAYKADIRQDDASIVITRADNGAQLIDTSIAGLIYCDKFLEFATYLPNNTDYYGFGENYRKMFKHDLEYQTLPMFARDRGVGDENGNNYGQHPFMMGVQKDGKAFGVFMLNSNAMAYTFLPAPGLSLKMTGGIMDIFVFVGENPEEVVSLYTSVIGRPVMPPFWALGYQQCRWGYKNTEDVNKTIQRNLKHKVPLDVQYMDIDYMDEKRDFTYSPKHFQDLPQLIKETQNDHNLRWTLILDPAIESVSNAKNHINYRPFNEGYAKDVFIKWPADVAKNIKFPPDVPTDKNVLYGKVWPHGPVAFPDFFKNATKQWWKQMIKELHDELRFDALWIDMNEPSNFDDSIQEYTCPNTEFFLKPTPMKYNEPLNAKTICLDALQGEHSEYRHYDVHSLYGWSESQPTLEGLREATNRRGFVVSRSTYPSSGKYVAHWLGDNSAEWDHLRQSIVGMMEFSLFGIAFTGADICGFNGATTPDLCRRWFQLGAYYPFSRSHNSIGQPEQDAGWWADNGHPQVTKAAVEALRVRYQFLHYYYTAFFRANQKGETVVRPMHHVFPTDVASRSMNNQFFIGSSVLLAPFLFPDQSSNEAYVPTSESEWFILDGDFVKKANVATNRVHMEESLSSFPLLLRGGSVIPVVSPDDLPEPLNTVTLRRAPISIWILPGYEKPATGTLFYDDGDSIGTIERGNYAHYEFTFDKCVLSINAINTAYSQGKAEFVLFKEILIALGNSLTGIRTDNIQVRFEGSNEDIPATVDEKHNIRIKFTHPLNMVSDLRQSKKLIIKKKDSDKCFMH